MSTVSEERAIIFRERRNLGRSKLDLEIPNLTEIQTRAYEAFLQPNTPPKERKNQGLEAVLRETFPIESYDGQMRLEYLYYELDEPRFDPDECRQLGLTYGRPLRVWLRLVKGNESIEEVVFFGDVPIMLGGGEFIINGAERVVVSQLHRSPGVDFVEETESGGRKTFVCRILPERGSWVEIHISRNETLHVRIDQVSRIPATMLVRAMSEQYATDEQLLRAFYKTKKVRLSSRTLPQIIHAFACGPIVDPDTGEILVESCQMITEEMAEEILDRGLREVEVVLPGQDPLVLNSIQEDQAKGHEDALVMIYQKLRPGNPADLGRARELFREKFFDPTRYRLGRVGRFRMNRKFGVDVDESIQTLRAEDLIEAIRYLMRLRQPNSGATTDDIDNLGNRRVRTVDELACEELRKGFHKLKRTVQERMSLHGEREDLGVRSLVNTKAVTAAMEYFFGRSELSQVVDQTNPLSQLTHERRLSALGPGGLNRKRAGFEVRDVHYSHYGRICPIETPEGTNIGLISSLAVYAGIDEYGFLITPYREVRKGKITNNLVWLRADQEFDKRIAPADIPIEDNRIAAEKVVVRYRGDYETVPADQVDLIDVSTKQMVGVSASLIPFLEHDDANRALMGSNMQRQAVPLLITEPPLVATGMEEAVAKNSSLVVRAVEDGTVTYVDAQRIVIDDRQYYLKKFTGLSDRTCLNQKPIVKVGDKVKAGQIIADGAATCQGQLALGRNVLAAFMSWEGYNFEDAIVISERLVRDDVYTSIHIQGFEAEIRETKQGREEFTRDIPNVAEKILRNLDENGIVRIGTYVRPGDILVGKIAPKPRQEMTPEEKLLHAIFGRAGEDVKNVSLEVPSGVEGVVIATQRFARKQSLSEEERKRRDEQLKAIEKEYNERIAQTFKEMIAALEELLGRELTDESGKRLRKLDQRRIRELMDKFDLKKFRISPQKKGEAQQLYRRYWQRIDTLRMEQRRKVNELRIGDELPIGVLQQVKVYLAIKRKISVGDKMAGRHGNKGVIAKILPIEDMPYLEDGTPVDIILNPLGVPSRMNVGQILETHLGWAAKVLGFQAICPVFDGPDEETIRSLMVQAGLPEDGKAVLYDGRTGERFEQPVTVGYLYMMKLHHLVDDKIHARATGPYSLITQQPLGGKARFGGQRFGEMEVWALEAYGAAYTLQELLTVKSDDVEGRTKIYESIVKGQNTLEAGMPASFEVLMNEIRGLALNIRLEKRRL